MNEPSALAKMASTYQLSEEKLKSTLQKTAFAGCKTGDEFAACVIVAAQHGLNPFLGEIYAFPQKGGVVPIVGIDGWLKLINSHPQFNGMTAEATDDSVTVSIHRKDREYPTVHTEFLEECRRNTDPWKTHPRRMLKWRAIAQAARIAFGFSGIYADPEDGPEYVTEVETAPPLADPLKLVTREDGSDIKNEHAAEKPGRIQPKSEDEPDLL